MASLIVALFGCIALVGGSATSARADAAPPVASAASADAGGASAAGSDAGAAASAATVDAGSADAATTPDASAPPEPAAADAGTDAASLTADDGGGAGLTVVQRLEPSKGSTSNSTLSTSPGLTGWSVGIHGGYSYAFGSANGGDSGGAGLNDIIAGAWSIGVDAGYFLTPNLYLGGYFTYGYGVIQGGANSVCDAASVVDTSCSADLFRFGVQAEYHFLPTEWVDPWILGGVGLDILNVSNTNDIDGSTNYSSALDGPYLSVGGGVDFKPGSFFGLGPYVQMDVGHFFGTDGLDLHGYFTGGLRARTNLGDL